MDIEDVLRAFGVVALFMNQNFLHEECRGIGHVDTLSGRSRIADGGGDKNLPR